MGDRKIPFSCPVCGRKTEYPAEELVEGAVLVCPFCKLTLKLHGHMLQDVQKEIGRSKGERRSEGEQIDFPNHAIPDTLPGKKRVGPDEEGGEG